ncbi:MAG TPA: phasin family protein [Burkholderiaceae bacterium]|nr:phasin family protein [Burkholderiaceae bacterium]
MVKKVQKTTAAKATKTSAAAVNPLAGAVKDSAQQIWLAGLGAFSKAQQEGTKAFESLVKEGLSIQRKTQAVAEERIAGATSRMTNMANDLTAKATGQWDKLETIFEDRVARTLSKLGVPTAQDIDALIERIDELNRNVQKLQPKASPTASAPKKAPAKKAAAPAAAPVKAKPAAKAPAARKAAARPAKASAPVSTDATPADGASAA